MAKRKNKKSTTESEVIVERISGADEFFRKYRFIFGAAAVLIILGVGGYFYYQNSLNEKNTEALDEIYTAEYYFEADSLEKALNGDGNYLGFLDLYEEYSGTKSANLSAFYIGVIYLKQGKFEDAVSYLSEFSSDDPIMGARALSLIGDAYAELGESTNAVEYYLKASEYKPNKYFTPIYLMKLALTYELADNKDAAIAAYDKVIDNYFNSEEAIKAKKYRAKLTGAGKE